MSEYIRDVPRDKQEAGGVIRTFTGKYVNPLAMRDEDLDIRDIAHHLSLECRYTGAIPYFYSVAQHSLVVAEMFSTPEVALAGLLHDASEAYLRDLPSPVKHDARFAFYREIEADLTQLIYKKFGVPEDPRGVVARVIKTADTNAFYQEVETFWGDKDKKVESPIPLEIWAADSKMAEAMFLSKYYQYRSHMCNKERL